MRTTKALPPVSLLALVVIAAACSEVPGPGEGDEEELGSSESFIGDGRVRCDGCSVAPHVQSFASSLCDEVGSCDSGSYNGHKPTAALAIDNFVPVSSAFGDRVAEWALANRGRFGAEYVIWKQRINFGSGWQMMEDRGSITQNHYDHVHISFFAKGGTGTGGTAGGGGSPGGPKADGVSVLVTWNGVPNHEASLDVVLKGGEVIAPCVAVDILRDQFKRKVSDGLGYGFNGDCKSARRWVGANEIEAFQLCTTANDDWSKARCTRSAPWNKAREIHIDNE